jgi:site-specific recombinase XerD
MLLELPTDEDRELVADFLLACMHQENIALTTKWTYLANLVYFSRYFDNKKSFKDMTDKDVVDYLGDIINKGRASAYPDEGWINTCNNRAMVFLFRQRSMCIHA